MTKASFKDIPANAWYNTYVGYLEKYDVINGYTDGTFNKDIRDVWRNDTACTDPKVAGDMLLPTFSKGTPEIDDSVYEYMKQLWDEECQKEDGNYRATAFKQVSKE